MIIDPDNAEVLDRMLPHHILIHIVDVRCMFFPWTDVWVVRMRVMGSDLDSDIVWYLQTYNWLVVSNMTFMTFHILGMSSSQLTFILNMAFMIFHSVGNVIIPTDFHSIIFFRGVGIPPPRQTWFGWNRHVCQTVTGRCSSPTGWKAQLVVTGDHRGIYPKNLRLPLTHYEQAQKDSPGASKLIWLSNRLTCCSMARWSKHAGF